MGGPARGGVALVTLGDVGLVGGVGPSSQPAAAPSPYDDALYPDSPDAESPPSPTRSPASLARARAWLFAALSGPPPTWTAFESMLRLARKLGATRTIPRAIRGQLDAARAATVPVLASEGLTLPELICCFAWHSHPGDVPRWLQATTFR